MVYQMKKLTVFALKSDADSVAERLMWCKCVEVSECDVGEAADLYSDKLSRDSERAGLERLDADTETALSVLQTFVRKKDKNRITPATREEFISSGGFDRAKNAVASALGIIERKNRLSQDISRLAAASAALIPWKGLDIPLSQTGSKNFCLLLGSFPSTCLIDDVRGELESEWEAYSELVHEDNSGFYCAVLCHASREEDVNRFLSQHGFLKASAAGYSDTPERELENLEEKRIAAEHGLSEADEELRAMLGSVSDMEILGDIVKTRLAVLRAETRMRESRDTVMLEGWVPVPMLEKVAGELDSFDCAYDFSDPKEEDDVPILLENPGIAKPFEEVLGLYSLPEYRTFDPTIVMGIFYFVIFGMMFADVGYGILLTAACIALLKIKKPKEGGSFSNLVKLFAICGVSSAVCGAIFGGYLGDLPTVFAEKIFGVENPADPALWFNPLNEPMLFLVASLVVGGVHLLTGMAIKMVLIWKSGHPVAAIFDVGSWFMLFGGVGLFFVIGIPGAVVAGVGVLMLIVSQGREEKNVIMKFLKGLLSLYDLVNYAADLLSYSRILALGLAASVIASVINMLATMGGPSGLIFGVIILIFGHALNLVINLLGTFVHTSRLQYIEFFGKFYEDGGRPFEPLLPVTDHIDR